MTAKDLYENSGLEVRLTSWGFPCQYATNCTSTRKLESPALRLFLRIEQLLNHESSHPGGHQEQYSFPSSTFGGHRVYDAA